MLASKVQARSNEDEFSLVTQGSVARQLHLITPSLDPTGYRFRRAFRNIFAMRNGMSSSKLDEIILGLTPRIREQIVVMANKGLESSIVARMLARPLHQKIGFLDEYPDCACGREIHHPSGLSELAINHGFAIMAGAHWKEVCTKFLESDVSEHVRQSSVSSEFFAINRVVDTVSAVEKHPIPGVRPPREFAGTLHFSRHDR